MLAPQQLDHIGDQLHQLHATPGNGTPLSQHQLGSTITHNMLQQNLVSSRDYSRYAPVLEEERMLQHSNSSISLGQGQGGRQMIQSNHSHSRSYANLQSSYSNSSGLVMRGADAYAESSPIDPLNGQHHPQLQIAGEFTPSSGSHGYNRVKPVAQGQYSASICNGDPLVATDMNGFHTSTPTNNVYLNSQTSAGDPKLGRQTSNTSSGYGTASSTERHSVVSMLSRDQSLGEIHLENSLQVTSTPPRKISAPPPNCGHKTKKMLSQQSHSLTNLSQDIPEYPYDHEENEHHEGEECRGHPSLQRQDTGHETKMVFARSGDSVSIERYQSAMGTKRKVPKQNAVEEGV